MAEWGRKEYAKKWPSWTPVWTWGAILLSLVFFAGMLTLQYERSWTAAGCLKGTHTFAWKRSALLWKPSRKAAKWGVMTQVLCQGRLFRFKFLIDWWT